MFKKVIFRIILVLFPVLFLVIAELVLRVSGYGTDLGLFRKSELYPGYYEINPDMSKRYFRKFTATTPSNDIFLIEKPDTCFRIFVLGCSTTRGFPYQSGTMFSRILFFRLRDAFPEKRIEVVNLSISAINSFAVKDMMPEVLEHNPDAILIYTGHNEYYGTLGVGSVENGGNFIWLKNLQMKLIHLRLYQGIQQIIGWMGSPLGDDTGRSRGGALMEEIAREKSIPYGSHIYNAGVEQFRINMNQVLKLASSEKVPVILSELVSNLKDQPPFKSQRTESFPPATEIFNLAKQMVSQGRFKEADSLYFLAKDLDVIRFRAPEAFNEVLHDLGRKYECPVIPMKSIFSEHSPAGIIGNNLMLEHLHPNIEGYFLMADAIFNSMKSNGFITDNWNVLPEYTSEYYRSGWGFTELDSMIGDLKIKMLKEGWPFKPENEINIFMRTYKPVNLVDSIAFHYVSNDSLHIEDQHVYLAGYYHERKQYYKAYREYKSLIASYPYVPDLYYNAVGYLISDGRFGEALGLLNSLPDPERDYRYHFTMGQLYSGNLQFAEGVTTLKRALSQAVNPQQEKNALISLYNLYHKASQPDEAEKIFTRLTVLDPTFGNPENVITPSDTEIKELTDKAIGLIKQNKTTEALELLFKANKIKETALVNKMIGSVYFMQRDGRAYTYYQKAFFENPLDPEVLNNLFLLSLMNNEPEQARFYLDKLRYAILDHSKIQKLEQLLEKKINELKNR